MLLMGTAKAPLIGFEALYDDGRMKGINTTKFRPLITPFEAVVKVDTRGEITVALFHVQFGLD